MFMYCMFVKMYCMFVKKDIKTIRLVLGLENSQ